MKSAKKRGSRSKYKRRCTTRKRSKGGMHRAARAASKFASQVFGKTGPERLDKLNQMKDVILKGAAKNEGAPRTPSSASSKSFAVDYPRLRIDPGMHMMDYDSNDTYYTTPKKSSENKTEVPILASRTRPEETPGTRVKRLASFVAPTSHHPDPIVKTLFPE